MGESQGAGGRGLARVEEVDQEKRRRSRAREGRWSKTGEDLSSRTSGAKRRKKTHDGDLFRRRQSHPRLLDPSPEPEKTRRTHPFVVLHGYETIFQGFLQPSPAVPSPFETTDVKSVSSSLCPAAVEACHLQKTTEKSPAGEENLCKPLTLKAPSVQSR